MAINLEKGQRISLVKAAPGLKRVLCGLGWDVAQRPKGLMSLFSNNHDYDLDASAIALDRNGKYRNTNNVIYFGNLRHPSGAITHLGDNLTGAGHGDDEQIIVDLTKIPADIETLMFVVNIYRCRDRQQDFSQVKNAFVRLENMENRTEIARYNLSGSDYQGCTGLRIAKLYRNGEGWDLTALGEGLQVNELKEILKQY
ncbi:TerD family protein [Spirulina sp. CCNP1310]|uniref:TerD family protein n=1 Tax=Spirulina sp. CCNP1310 TaxID=3110249 RepID=UPI002B20F31C|nr:TerD family protein [Spirulina sp. CCNP1310]MEA5420007.1 TerD family protein [Spirulina sp. CCNP1310]